MFSRVFSLCHCGSQVLLSVLYGERKLTAHEIYYQNPWFCLIPVPLKEDLKKNLNLHMISHLHSLGV